VPQVVPFAMGVAVSMQVCAPVAHEVVPATHLFGLVEQATPAVQEMQVPLPLHTWFVPQDVPGAIAVVVSTQVWAPVAHEVVPATHAFGLVEQARPAVQEMQVPLPLQTWFVPHDVPGAMGVVVFEQTWKPVSQVTDPATQLFGFVLHA